MAGSRARRNRVLRYGSPETPEDLEFWLTCEPKTKDTELTVYVDNTGTKVGQAMPIEISVGSAKTTVKGKIATDEMTGFYHAVATEGHSNHQDREAHHALAREGPCRGFGRICQGLHARLDRSRARQSPLCRLVTPAAQAPTKAFLQ